VAIYECWKTELPGKNYRASRKVIEQDRCAVSAIVSLPDLLLPGSIVMQEVERRLFSTYQSLDNVSTTLIRTRSVVDKGVMEAVIA
jgi:hypothetical protein